MPVMTLLASHTLVIPTYNRHELLARLLGYYRQAADPLALLVLDSSRDEVASANAALCAGLGPRVRHLGFPSTLPMAAKIAAGLAEVATPTASFCADDDLVFPDGLDHALAVLRDDPGQVAAHGLYLNFREDGRDVHVMREYAGPGNEAGHPGARLFRLFQRYESLFYAAFRTADLRAVMAAAQHQPTLHFQELFQSSAATLLGKVHRFTGIYAARRSGPAAEPERDKWQTYYWFAEDPAEILRHYLDYRAALLAFYRAHCPAAPLSDPEFVKVLDLAHAVYFGTGCPPAYFHSVLQPLWPDTPFFKPDSVDLFTALRPMTEKPALSRVVALLRRLRRRRAAPAARWRDAATALERDIARQCATPWHCRLAEGLHWLAAAPGFRTAFAELCRYLDGPRVPSGQR